MRYSVLSFLILVTSLFNYSFSQVEKGRLLVRPTESDAVLINPGIGFTTFYRFNDNPYNYSWSDDGSVNFQSQLDSFYHPQASMAYFRFYWKNLETKKGVYRWDIIDKVLERGVKNNQTVIIRLMPYGSIQQGFGQLLDDVPDWYRKMVGDKIEWGHNLPINRWVVDPEDARYIENYGNLIKEFAERYDGHPQLEAVDISIVGAWGEGAGSELLIDNTRKELVNLYLDNFKKTPLIALLTDKKTNEYISSRRKNSGWRADCLGDLGMFTNDPFEFSHMYDVYPQGIINYGLSHSWQKAPVHFELCHTFYYWKERSKYDTKELQYIIDESLKWHISVLNAKSSPFPIEWKPQIDEWLKKMGYRFVLRRFVTNSEVNRGDSLKFQTWWVNKGVAPIYRDFNLSFRLCGEKDTITVHTKADLKTWLPGDVLFDDALLIPKNVKIGNYKWQVAITDKVTSKPKVKIAIDGIDADGWYPLGEIFIK